MMPYSYAIEKPKLFTEEGQVLFLKVRDRVNHHIKESGAVSFSKALTGITGDGWEHIACIDRMIELGELICLSPDNVWTQHKIYTKEVLR